MKPTVGHEARRLLIACAFILGTGSFVGVAVPLVAAIAVDYVPVVPVALATAAFVSLFGGVVGLGAARRWYSVLVGSAVGLAAGVLAAAAGYAAVTAPAAGSLAWGVRSLDDAGWRDAQTQPTGFNARGKMVFALIATRTVHGSSRLDVRRRLGAPDCHSAPGNDAWRIGQWTGLQIDADCLFVGYDDDIAETVDVRRSPSRAPPRAHARAMVWPQPRRPPSRATSKQPGKRRRRRRRHPTPRPTRPGARSRP